MSCDTKICHSSWFYSVRNVVLQNLPEVGKKEVDGTEVAHEIKDGSYLYSLKNLEIGRQTYDISLAETSSGDRSISINSSNGPENISLTDLNGNGFFDTNDKLSWKNGTEEKTLKWSQQADVFSFMQRDIIEGIVNRPTLLGEHRFTTFEKAFTYSLNQPDPETIPEEVATKNNPSFDQAHNITSGPSIVTVIGNDHFSSREPFLKNRLAWNANETPNGLDDDNNGYVDDTISPDSFNSFRRDSYVLEKQKERVLTPTLVYADNLTKGANIRVLPMEMPTNFAGGLQRTIDYARSRGSRIITFAEHPMTSDILNTITKNQDLLFVIHPKNNSATKLLEKHSNVITVSLLDSQGTAVSNYTDSLSGKRKLATKTHVAARGKVRPWAGHKLDRGSLEEEHHKILAAPAVINTAAKIMRIAPHLSVEQVADIIERRVDAQLPLAEQTAWGGKLDPAAAFAEATRLKKMAPPEVMAGKKGLFVLKNTPSGEIDLEAYLQSRNRTGDIRDTFIKAYGELLSQVKAAKVSVDAPRYVAIDFATPIGEVATLSTEDNITTIHISPNLEPSPFDLVQLLAAAFDIKLDKI